MAGIHSSHELRHPDMPDPTILTRIGDRLRQRLGAERVIVYGSVARLEATIHSDIDLLVVAPSGQKPLERMADVHAAIRDLSRGLPISPMVYTPDELQQRIARGDPFTLEVLESGVDV